MFVNFREFIGHGYFRIGAVNFSSEGGSYLVKQYMVYVVGETKCCVAIIASIYKFMK
jgi:hypothetical protein